jgi:hypothetical protein
MTLDAAVVDALRDGLAKQPEWPELRLTLERYAARDPEHSYDPFICAFGFDLVSPADEERRRDVGNPFAPGLIPWRFPASPGDVGDDYAEVWRQATTVLDDPVALARLHDLLWVRRTRPRPDVHARAAADAYIGLGTASGREGFDRLGCLTRALELGREIRDDETIDRAVEGLVAFVDEVLDTPERGPGYALGGLRALVDLSPRPPGALDRLFGATESRFGDEPRLFGNLAELRVRGMPREEQLALRREHVHRWRRSAARVGGLLRVHRLEQALGIARTHGLNDEADAVLVELQEVRPEDIAIETITAEVEIPGEAVRSVIANIVEGPDWQTSLRRFGAFGPPSGNRQELEEELADERGRFVFHQVFGRSVMSSESAAARFRATDDESRARLELAERRAFRARIWSPILGDMLIGVEAKHGRPPRDELTAFFATDVIGLERAERIARALELFWDGQFDECAHVIVPRLESVVREFARLAGIPVIREPVGQEPGGARSLGTLLVALREDFPRPDWHDYLFCVLADPLGLNLRNTIAHGLMPVAGRGPAALLLHTACFLRLVGVGPPADKEA